MQTSYLPIRSIVCLVRSVSLLALRSLGGAGALLLAVSSASAADSGATLSGNVSNVATGNLLQGARVEIPALHL